MCKQSVITNIYNLSVNMDDMHRIFNQLYDLKESITSAIVNGEPTEHSEMLHAVLHIIYRFLNSGDSMFVDYGCETCGSEAAYLKNELPEHFAQVIHFGSHQILEADNQTYINLLHQMATIAIEVCKTPDATITGKKIADYEPEWDNQKCVECCCYFPIEDLESDGMGSHFCTGCIEKSDYDDGYDY